MAEQETQASKLAQNFATFLTLQQLSRESETAEALAFNAVNETSRMLDYQRAILIRHLPNGSGELVAISGVSQFERLSPYSQFLHQLYAHFQPKQHQDTQATSHELLDQTTAPDHLRSAMQKWNVSHIMCCRLFSPSKKLLGILIFCRSQAPFTPSEQTLLAALSASYAYSWFVLHRSHWLDFLGRSKNIKRHWWLLIALTVMCVPIRQTILAPAQTVPAIPTPISAPMEGVIKEVLVKPSDNVTQGQPLFRYDALALESAFHSAKRALDVAKAELLQNQQGAFNNKDARANVALIQARINTHQVEMDFAQERLKRVTVTAPQEGVVVFSDPDHWLGKPVVTGERVMIIGNPTQVSIKLDIPVSEAMIIQQGAPVRMFADISPLSPISATLDYVSYASETSKHGFLAYSARADLNEGETTPRIGLHGTAKLSGEFVPLAYYLLRRPLASLRQMIGW